jgi:hypothetical protein
VLRQRKLKDLFLFLLCCAFAFFLSGGVDYLLTGQFHGSIHGYLDYNLRFSGVNHGHQPFYVFILLFFALSFPFLLWPFRLPTGWKEAWQRHQTPLTFFSIFVIVHSLSPHKEERFMIPILPIFLVLLTPMIGFLMTERRYLRLGTFLTLNTVLLLITITNTPQSNILGLVRFLSHSRHLNSVYGWKDTLVLFPSAFSERPLRVEEMNEQALSQLKNLTCADSLAVRKGYLSTLPFSLEGFSPIARFEPGPFEALLVKLNPTRNARRGAIELFIKKGCEDS